MVKPNILVVDCDEGFGLMLKEGLQNSGLYASRWVQTGSDALQSVVEAHFDLVIVDMALTDMAAATLIKAVREAKNETKIMVIPLIGQSVPKSIDALKVNGVLTKPFFVGDLPDLIDKAIGRARQRTQTPMPVPVPVPNPACRFSPARGYSSGDCLELSMTSLASATSVSRT